MTGFVPDKPDVWFSSEDIPLWIAGHLNDPGPWILASWSRIYYTVQLDNDDERCDFRDDQRLVSCMMWKHHDTPHMPRSDEATFKLGPVVIVKMSTEDKRVSPK